MSELITISTLAKSVHADPRTLTAALRDVEPEAQLVQPSGRTLALYNAERTESIAKELFAQAEKAAKEKADLAKELLDAAKHKRK